MEVREVMQLICKPLKMDLLDKIQCQPYDLTIAIGQIEYGWMDITLVSHYAFKQYTVSDLCDPINDLLEKFALLHDDVPYQINPFRSVLNLAVIEHDLEGDTITWLLRKKNEDLYVYIWQNTYEMEDWLCAGFSEQYYTDNLEEVPNLAKNLLFSMKGTLSDFANTLITTLDSLSEKDNELELTDSWGYRFSALDYQKIKTMVNVGR